MPAFIRWHHFCGVCGHGIFQRSGSRASVSYMFFNMSYQGGAIGHLQSLLGVYKLPSFSLQPSAGSLVHIWHGCCMSLGLMNLSPSWQALCFPGSYHTSNCLCFLSALGAGAVEQSVCTLPLAAWLLGGIFSLISKFTPYKRTAGRSQTLLLLFFSLLVRLAGQVGASPARQASHSLASGKQETSAHHSSSSPIWSLESSTPSTLSHSFSWALKEIFTLICSMVSCSISKETTDNSSSAVNCSADQVS